jgi:uncharacterized membrane protein
MRIAEADIHRVFHAGLWVKAGHNLLEELRGLARVFLSHDLMVRIATALTRGELFEEFRDPLASVLRRAADGLTTDAQPFAARSLTGHEVIKLVLVAGVLTNRARARAAGGDEVTPALPTLTERRPRYQFTQDRDPSTADIRRARRQ